MKYSGAPLYDGAPPTHDTIFCEFLYATGPADRLDKIQDHRSFLVVLVVFSQSAPGLTETLGLRILAQLYL